MSRSAVSLLAFVLLDVVAVVPGMLVEELEPFSQGTYLNLSILHRGEEKEDGAALASFLLQNIPFPPKFAILADDAHEDVALQLQRSLHQAGLSITTFTFSPLLTGLTEVLTSPTSMSRRHYVITLCSKENIIKVFEQAQQRALQAIRVTWVVMAREHISRQIENLLQEGTQVVLVVRRNNKIYSLFSTRVQANGDVKLHRAGTWNTETAAPPTTPSSFTPFEDLYRDFGGRELVVAANDNWPFFGVEEVEEVEEVEGVEGEEGGERRLRPTSGIDVSIMEALKRSLNFTYRVVSPADGKWGGPQPDGTVTGIIGLVARREADIAICEITITGSRESVVDFTWPYYLESVTLVSRAPAPKQRTFAVLWPFTLEVWLCIILSTLAVGPVMKGVLHRTPPTAPGVSAPPPPSVPLQVLSFNFFRNLVVQGNLLQVKSWPGRFVFFFWYLFCFIVYALYSGTLTAVLAVPAFERPINSLGDLSEAKENGYTVGTIQDSSLEFIFKEAKGGIYQEVWQLFDHEDRARSFLPHPDLGFDKIQSEKFVFVNPELNSKIRAAQRGRDEFYFGRQTFYPQGYGIACYSGAPFLGVFNQMLGRMISAGLVNKWAQDEVQKVSRTSSTSRKGVAGGPSAITLEHLQAAFFILLIGFLLSLLALLLEIIVTKI